MATNRNDILAFKEVLAKVRGVANPPTGTIVNYILEKQENTLNWLTLRLNYRKTQINFKTILLKAKLQFHLIYISELVSQQPSKESAQLLRL